MTNKQQPHWHEEEPYLQEQPIAQKWLAGCAWIVTLIVAFGAGYLVRG